MKKLYDADVSLTLNITNLNKRIHIMCSIHTLIHQLKIEVCKKLSLPVFDTEMDIYALGASTVMKPTSSLQQNGIDPSNKMLGAGLAVRIKRLKINQKLPVKVEEDHDRKVKKNQDEAGTGLLLTAMCTNQCCSNYQQDMKIDYGYGTYPFYQLISDLKCSLCPYKSQYLRPTMMCKSVQVIECLYQLKGKKSDYGGIPSDKKTGFIKCSGKKNIMKKIIEGQWDKETLLLQIKHP